MRKNLSMLAMLHTAYHWRNVSRLDPIRQPNHDLVIVYMYSVSVFAANGGIEGDKQGALGGGEKTAQVYTNTCFRDSPPILSDQFF
jgi:hypothetical protein